MQKILDNFKQAIDNGKAAAKARSIKEENESHHEWLLSMLPNEIIVSNIMPHPSLNERFKIYGFNNCIDEIKRKAGIK